MMKTLLTTLGFTAPDSAHGAYRRRGRYTNLHLILSSDHTMWGVGVTLFLGAITLGVGADRAWDGSMRADTAIRID